MLLAVKIVIKWPVKSEFKTKDLIFGIQKLFTNTWPIHYLEFWVILVLEFMKEIKPYSFITLIYFIASVEWLHWNRSILTLPHIILLQLSLLFKSDRNWFRLRLIV